MRKIKSEEDIKRGKKRVKIIVGAVLVFLMVFSTAGFALYGQSDSNSGAIGSSNPGDPGFGSNYNGQYWVYQIGGQEFYFTNVRELTQNIPVEIQTTLQDYTGSNIFVDSDDREVLNEISISLGRYTQRLQEACYGSCEENLPEKDCTENLIVFSESENSRVYQEDKCVFIEGDLTSVDAFLYRILGI